MTTIQFLRRHYVFLRLRAWRFAIVRAGRRAPYTWAIDLGPLHIFSTPSVRD